MNWIDALAAKAAGLSAAELEKRAFLGPLLSNPAVQNLGQKLTNFNVANFASPWPRLSNLIGLRPAQPAGSAQPQVADPVRDAAWRRFEELGYTRGDSTWRQISRGVPNNDELTARINALDPRGGPKTAPPPTPTVEIPQSSSQPNAAAGGNNLLPGSSKPKPPA